MESIVHTYSIVARDPVTGEMGGAVQSHYFRSGTVLCGEVGVGVVASQASADPSYGPLGLALMRAGRSPEDALRGLVAADAYSTIRQVAMLDASGRVAAHTGADTIPEAGHIVADQFAVQANMMLRASVWPAMAKAFRASTGHLAERMLAALVAAEAEGGDIRGMQSAGLLLVTPPSPERPRGQIDDLRVDDSPRPLEELQRLLRVGAGYIANGQGARAFALGDIEGGNRQFERAAELVGNNPEMRFWHAIALLRAGRIEAGLAKLREAAAGDRNWIELALRLPDKIYQLDRGVKEQIRRMQTS
ncbi:MAG TPA: DUF1028 domain-containing protein [Candidatus Binataceae bacterium]|nr:DUF1028 domain-containing protein [Candidatus Binataceae bacterium]